MDIFQLGERRLNAPGSLSETSTGFDSFGLRRPDSACARTLIFQSQLSQNIPKYFHPQSSPSLTAFSSPPKPARLFVPIPNSRYYQAGKDLLIMNRKERRAVAHKDRKIARKAGFPVATTPESQSNPAPAESPLNGVPASIEEPPAWPAVEK